MATLQELQLRRRALEDRLHDGDLAAERALELIDRAIAGRSLKIQHSHQRLDAAKQAVAAGMDKDEARRLNSRVVAKQLTAIRAREKLRRS